MTIKRKALDLTHFMLAGIADDPVGTFKQIANDLAASDDIKGALRVYAVRGWRELEVFFENGGREVVEDFLCSDSNPDEGLRAFHQNKRDFKSKGAAKFSYWNKKGREQ